MSDLAAALRASSGRLGIDPLDLGTAISYETAGTWDPWKAGPTTKWGQHRGLIQWGEPQRQKYGVTQGMPVADQLTAVERYLTDAGVRPGHGLLDIYSAINAGRVGRYGASDAAAGGAPGTVQDKVNGQMAGHRAKAEALLGGGSIMPAVTAGAPIAPPQGVGDVMQGVPMPTALVPDMASIATAFSEPDVRQKQQAAAAELARKKALFGDVGSLYSV